MNDCGCVAGEGLPASGHFVQHGSKAEKVAPRVHPFAARLLRGHVGHGPTGAQLESIDPPAGPAYVTSDIWRRLPSAVIVYGTLRDAGANRYAAEQMQRRFLDRYESEVPIYKDFEASEELLHHRDVVFVGRPEANSALALWSPKLGLDYQGAAFKIDGDVHPSEREALILTAENPFDAAHMVLVVAGNDALSTVKAQSAELSADEYVIFRDGGAPTKGFISSSRQRDTRLGRPF